MGPIGKNFYAELVRQYGYDDVVTQVAEAYAEGRRAEASAFVTDELVDEVGFGWAAIARGGAARCMAFRPGTNVDRGRDDSSRSTNIGRARSVER